MPLFGGSSSWGYDINYDKPIELRKDNTPCQLIVKLFNPFNRFKYVVLVKRNEHDNGVFLGSYVEFFDKKGYSRYDIHGPSLRNA